MIKRGIYAITLISVLMLVGWVIIDSRKPRVRSLDVVRANQDLAVIKGRNFGTKQGKVFLNSIALDESHILSWDSHEVQFAIPEQFSAGLVSIEVASRRSNAMLFLRNETIVLDPKPQEIIVLESLQAQLGELIRIELPFDVDIETIKVYYSNATDSLYPVIRQYLTYLANNVVSVQISDSDIDSIVIHTSRTVIKQPIETELVSALQYDKPRTYFLAQTVLSTADQLEGIRRRVIIPQIQNEAPLQVVQPLEPLPFPALHYVSAAFRVTHGVQVTSHRTVWDITDRELEQRYAEGFSQRYLRAVPLSENLRTVHDTLSRGLTTPSITTLTTLHARLDASFFEENELTAMDASLILLSLLRRLAIPAKLVNGYIYRERLIPHTWTAFFVVGVGWVPFDPFYLYVYGGSEADTEGSSSSIFYTDNTHIALAEDDMSDMVLNPQGEHLAQFFPPVEQNYSANGAFFFVSEKLLP